MRSIEIDGSFGEGGTHVPFSPTYDYISEVFIPMLKKIAIKVEASIIRYGFYPKGGGEVSFRIFPAEKIEKLHAVKKGELLSITGHSAVSNLPACIAERQKNAARQGLLPLNAQIDVHEVSSYGQGTFIFFKTEERKSLRLFHCNR